MQFKIRLICDKKPEPAFLGMDWVNYVRREINVSCLSIDRIENELNWNFRILNEEVYGNVKPYSTINSILIDEDIARESGRFQQTNAIEVKILPHIPIEELFNIEYRIYKNHKTGEIDHVFPVYVFDKLKFYDLWRKNQFQDISVLHSSAVTDVGFKYIAK